MVGNVIATAIDPDPVVARAAVREYLRSVYAKLPNYRASWREAGFDAEVATIEHGLDSGDDGEVRTGLSDDLIAECCLAVTPDALRERLDGWFDAGIDLPVLQLVAGPDPSAQARELVQIYT